MDNKPKVALLNAISERYSETSHKKSQTNRSFCKKKKPHV